MKIGIFDSGLGGMIIAKAIRKKMPEYDYVYLGDTKRVPYGNRSHDAVFEFTCEALEYLFKKENCIIVIIACNTASARALRRVQQEYLKTLPERFSDRKVLGVLIPSAEEAALYSRIGVLATRGTIISNTFPDEINKIVSLKKEKNLMLFCGSHSNLNVVNESNVTYAEKSIVSFPLTKVFQNSAPILVPLAEEGEMTLALPFLKKYLKPLLAKNINALVLGCTHYPVFKNAIKKIVGRNVKIISQDEIIPDKLQEYFLHHPEITQKLSKNKNTQNHKRYGNIKILVTDITQNIEKFSKKWFGKNAKLELVEI